MPTGDVYLSEIAQASDKCLQLLNIDHVAPMWFENYWTRLRLCFRLSIEDTEADLTNAMMFVGVNANADGSLPFTGDYESAAVDAFGLLLGEPDQSSTWVRSTEASGEACAFYTAPTSYLVLRKGNAQVLSADLGPVRMVASPTLRGHIIVDIQKTADSFLVSGWFDDDSVGHDIPCNEFVQHSAMQTPAWLAAPFAERTEFELASTMSAYPAYELAWTSSAKLNISDRLLIRLPDYVAPADPPV